MGRFIWHSVVIVILVIQLNQLCHAEQKEAEKPFIDYLTADYLQIEQGLWSKISGRHNRDDQLFEQIRSAHQPFIRTDFGAEVTLQNAYVPSAGILLANVNLVNSLFYNASVLLNSPISQIDIIYLFRTDILPKSIEYAGYVYRESSRANFWQKGKDYLMHCRENENSLITIEAEYHLIYNYYKDVRAALLKTYILTQLSHMLQNINSKENRVVVSTPTHVKDELFARVDLIKRNVKNLLRIAKRDSWICDRQPEKHDKEQVSNFLQGYIDNEINLNEKNTCTKSCGDFIETAHHRCAPNTPCAEQSADVQRQIVCNGRILECQDVDHDDFVINYSNAPNRRIQNVVFRNGDTSGAECSDTVCTAKSRAKSWRHWFVKCNNCYCLCDDAAKSERHFSLHPVVSDVEQNKVVTGVRILKQNGVLQLSISQRTLHKFGQTDDSEQDTWKLADTQFAVSDRGIIDGIDYFTLTYENRSVNLDDLRVPKDKVVTGVRFHQLNGHLILQIRATDFDYFNGTLTNIAHNPWVMNEHGGQYEIEIPKRTNPATVSPDGGIQRPNRLPNSFVRFGPTEFDADLGQLTVPFIETTPLESKNPIILNGIGLTYKTNDASGGFIALKTIAYEFEVADPKPDEQYDYID